MSLAFLSTVSSLLHCLRASALACSCAPVEPSGHFSDASPLLVPAPSDNHELTALTEYLRKLIKYLLLVSITDASNFHIVNVVVVVVFSRGLMWINLPREDEHRVCCCWITSGV